MKIGITGHQDIGSNQTIRWVTEVLGRVLTQHPVELGYTCLAVGADQLFAEVLRQNDVPYVAIIPSRDYESTFQTQADLNRYQKLLQGAHQTIGLPFDQSGGPAYFAAGKKVVQLCDLLIAIWNGKPAKGLGGTGDVVLHAISTGKPVVHINPIEQTVRRFDN